MTPSAQPTSLPALLYLLSIDLDRHKLADRKKTGYIVRAAALVDLSLRGNLTADADGTVRIRSHAPTGDPVLDTVLRGIADDHHHSWKDWIRRHDHETLDALEDQLISAGAVSVERRAFLGDKVEVTDPPAIHELRQDVLSTLTGGQQIEQLDVREVALTALAANGELSTAIPDRERKANKARIRDLTERIGASTPALKSLVDELHRPPPTGFLNAVNAPGGPA